MTEEERRKEIIAEFVQMRRDKGLTQKQLEELSGVKQPIIARMEAGTTSPRLSTLIKLLTPLGKTLRVEDIPSSTPV